MSDAIPLPPRPNLDQYKKLARDLQHACASTDPGAVRTWAARWIDALTRLRGSADWLDPSVREREAEKLERHWNERRESFAQLAACTLAGAQFFIAREHGFTSWPAFARHVQELAHASSPASAFEAAADAIVSGDAATLRQLLARHPRLARARSSREHRSTLLHYVSGNGVEDFRQRTPGNIVEIANLLLEAGADVDAESDAYGGGCTALGLAATSIHPEKAGVQIELLRTLLDGGASLHRLAGGNRHSIVHGCIANGQPGAAKFLADLGAPVDLESAAAMGRLDMLQSCFDGGAGREPSRAQIESALRHACGYGHVDAARFLLDRGVDPAARDDEGQTALHWAAWHPHTDAIELLLSRGAPVGLKDVRFHATPLDVALWSWNNAETAADRDGYYQTVAMLARAGATLDRDHWRDRAKGDSAVLNRIDRDPQMLAALRGETRR